MQGGKGLEARGRRVFHTGLSQGQPEWIPLQGLREDGRTPAVRILPLLPGPAKHPASVHAAAFATLSCSCNKYCWNRLLIIEKRLPTAGSITCQPWLMAFLHWLRGTLITQLSSNISGCSDANGCQPFSRHPLPAGSFQHSGCEGQFGPPISYF